MGPTDSTNEGAPQTNRQHEHSTADAAKDDDDFPWKQLIVLALCRLAEPIAFTSISAYSFVMVQSIKGEENASFYSGLLISAFALAEASTAMFWGYLSDRYGRKPIILVALAGTAVSSLIFGFAQNYWIALAARVIGGLLNGNVAVMQTMVAEMVSKPEHEPKAYAMQPFMWSVGSVAGSALGGFTAEPAKYHPGLFSKDGLFGHYPYLLPNLVSVVVILIAMIQGWLLLEETNVAVVSHRDVGAHQPHESIVDETTPLTRTVSSMSRTSPKARRLSTSSYIATSAPLPVEPSFDLRRPSVGSIMSLKGTLNKIVIEEESIPEDSVGEGTSSPTNVKAFTRPVVLWIAALFLICYLQMAFVSLLPIYLLDEPQKQPKQLDLSGGLGLTLPDVGSYLAVNSVASMVTQGVVFPIFVGRLGVWTSVISLTILCPVLYILAPFTTILPQPGIGMYVIMFLYSIYAVIVYPSLLILLKHAVASPQVLGRVNGLAMSLCSAARTLSPPVVGIVYGILGSAAAWWSCALVGVVAAVELIVIPRPRDDNQEILRRASIATERV